MWFLIHMVFYTKFVNDIVQKKFKNFKTYSEIGEGGVIV
jgi:hypothetical protein